MDLNHLSAGDDVFVLFVSLTGRKTSCVVTWDWSSTQYKKHCDDD